MERYSGRREADEVTRSQEGAGQSQEMHTEADAGEMQKGLPAL